MLNLSKEVLKEKQIHGNKWNGMHGGYFALQINAQVLMDMILDACSICEPDLICDLGAGTGTVLHWLSEKLPNPIPKLLAMDISEEQLNIVKEKYSDNITPINDSFVSFIRRDIPELNNQKTLFISRSTFHYVGQKKFPELIKHIRKQMKAGEVLIHQTACFLLEKDAQLLNTLYSMMNSSKWYPSLDLLIRVFAQNGFSIEKISLSPPLPLESHDLKIRYDLSDKKIALIIKTIRKNFPHAEENVFYYNSNSFTAFLHYFCIHCIAI